MTDYTSELLKNLQTVAQASRLFFMQNKERFSGQQRVLNILAKQDGLTQGELAEILDIRPSSVAELLKKLENSGAITRQTDENDGRIKHVYLTEDGRIRAQKNSGEQDDLSEEFFAGLTEEEQRQFGDYLKKISDGWNETIQAKMSFGDPMERLKAMQEMHEMQREFGADSFDNLHVFGQWRRHAGREFREMFHNREAMKDMTPEERQELKEKFYEESRRTMGEQFGHRGGGRRCRRGFGHRGVPTFDEREKHTDAESEWKDF
ncbi:MAG: MarR family transcriptional regulator [Lactobacillales bacterium]|jgi:DNA-binding MarR family transcriptional regulator|nr:MarR family transcriptional regulator [Lactobacillales bacterium]